MNVVGVGVDVVDVGSFEEQLSQPGSRFDVGAFTAGERTDLAATGPGIGDPRSVAARYAAKEAFIKAWSASRFGSAPALPRWELREVEVVRDAHGRPALRLSGRVASAVRDQWGEGWRAHVSLSHDGPVAAAFVVIEALATGPAAGRPDPGVVTR